MVARCSCPDGERGRSVEEPASRVGDGGKENGGRYTIWGGGGVVAVVMVVVVVIAQVMVVVVVSYDGGGG